MVRAAIVGLGRWGRSLVTSVQGKSDEIRFVAGHTRTPASAEAFCREHGITLADSDAAILSDRSIDAVVIATPHSQHEQQALQAAAAGKHVFVEKPLTLDRHSSRAVADKISAAGLTLALGFNRRFHPSIGEVRTRLRDGRMGKLVAMTGHHTTSTAAFIPPENWRANPKEAPAGAMTAVGVHLLDAMLEFGGRVRDVQCVTGSYGSSSEDTTTVLMRFESGVAATIFCSVATATNFNFSIYGSKGLSEITGAALETFRFVPVSDKPPTGHVIPPPAEVIDHSGVDTLRSELVAFARAVKGQEPYPVPLHDVLHGMAVFDAVVKAAASGQIEPVVED
jgi:predicted dehydrogenase